MKDDKNSNITSSNRSGITESITGPFRESGQILPPSSPPSRGRPRLQRRRCTEMVRIPVSVCEHVQSRILCERGHFRWYLWGDATGWVIRRSTTVSTIVSTIGHKFAHPEFREDCEIWTLKLFLFESLIFSFLMVNNCINLSNNLLYEPQVELHRCRCVCSFLTCTDVVMTYMIVWKTQPYIEPGFLEGFKRQHEIEGLLWSIFRNDTCQNDTCLESQCDSEIEPKLVNKFEIIYKILDTIQRCRWSDQVESKLFIASQLHETLQTVMSEKSPTESTTTRIRTRTFRRRFDLTCLSCSVTSRGHHGFVPWTPQKISLKVRPCLQAF